MILKNSFSQIGDTIFFKSFNDEYLDSGTFKVIDKDDFNYKLIFKVSNKSGTDTDDKDYQHCNKIIIYDNGTLHDEYGKSIHGEIYLSKERYLYLNELDKCKNKIRDKILFEDSLSKIKEILKFIENYK